MKTLSSFFTRQNTWRTIAIIAGINLYLLITYPIYVVLPALCSLIISIIFSTEKIYGMYYFLHTDKYRIAFVSPKVWIENDKELKTWFFSHHIFYPDCNTEIRQLYILGFGFGIKFKL